MTVRFALKGCVESLPESVGKVFSCVPFSVRLGWGYRRAAKGIDAAERTATSVSDEQRLLQLRTLLKHAVQTIEFYRELYGRNGFTPDDLRSLDDWSRVPIVTKAELQGVPLEARSARAARGMRVNTGGSSGEPLEFLLGSNAYAIEWAHMHNLWRARGYSPRHAKLTFRGKHFDRAKALRYNAVHNEYIINSICPMAQIRDAVAELLQSTVVRWVHGYPSQVAEFAHAWGEVEPSAATRLRSNLFGVLLSSEYPAPVYRSVIDRVLSTNVVSWYGHSEMAVLARESAFGIYESFPTYGYAEAVALEGARGHRLVCTSLHNRVHPFIRYDTGDLIEPVSQQGGSLAFRISEGRVGDFVLDRHGNRLALTGVIFGRHHRAFELLQHLQVRDDGQGRIVFVATPLDPALDIEVLRRGFDLQGLEIDWRIEVVKSPIRTQAGKIRLKIQKSEN